MVLVAGKSYVDFECVEATDLVLIHSNKLNYTVVNKHLAQLSGLGGATAPAMEKSWLQPVTQYLVIQLAGKLEKGNSYRLYTEFTGELADDLGGFYRSEYLENGRTKYV